MRLSRCPSCHAHLNLDTLIQDSSAKSLLAAVAKIPPRLATNLIAYIALFRPEKSDLNNARALRLINETLELGDNNNAALVAALEKTIANLQAKRQQGSAQPLKNHGYLKQVLESIKEEFFHPVNSAQKEKGTTIEIKSPGFQETKAQSQAKFDEFVNKHKKDK